MVCGVVAVAAVGVVARIGVYNALNSGTSRWSPQGAITSGAIGGLTGTGIDAVGRTAFQVVQLTSMARFSVSTGTQTVLAASPLPAAVAGKIWVGLKSVPLQTNVSGISIRLNPVTGNMFRYGPANKYPDGSAKLNLSNTVHGGMSVHIAV